MTKSSCPLKLPTSIKDAAARLAKQDGVSETIVHFLGQRAGKAMPSDMMEALNAAPDLAPLPEDALA